MKVTDKEKSVLTALVEDYDTSGWDETGFWSFDPLAKKTGLERRIVRLACRSLARKGLAKFMRGLVNMDGEMAGAGYGATKEGALLIMPCVECGFELKSFNDGKCDKCWHDRKCAKCGKAYKDHVLKNGYMVEFEEVTTTPPTTEELLELDRKEV